MDIEVYKYGQSPNQLRCLRSQFMTNCNNLTIILDASTYI